MRDLCVRKAQEENFIHLFDRRRVIIHSDIYGHDHHLEDIYGSYVRSLKEETSFPTSFLLRVWDALRIRFHGFPVKIMKLVNLRFIVLKCIGTIRLPASISNLFNLQTLIIYSLDTVKLPSDIWKVPRLRHIWTWKCFLAYPSAAGNGEKIALLENLQTLKGVIDFKFTKKVLQMMPNLKKLKIGFPHSCPVLSSFCMDKFIHLHQLEDLNCDFTYKSDRNYPLLGNFHPLLENFHLPPTLKKLTLRGCRLSWKSMAIIGSLTNLEVLNLKEFTFDGSVWEPTEGKFLQLKVLLLSKTDLEHLKADETNFPSLQHLTFIDCRKLVEIPSAIGDIPTLQVIELCRCRTSAVNSIKLIQEEQRDLGNNLQIIIHDSDMLEIGIRDVFRFMRALNIVKSRSESEEVGSGSKNEALSRGRGQEEEDISLGRIVEELNTEEIFSHTPLMDVISLSRSSPQAQGSGDREVGSRMLGRKRSEVEFGYRSAPIWKCKFFPSEAIQKQLRDWHRAYMIPDDVEFIVPGPDDRADDPFLGSAALNQAMLAAGLCLPFSRIIKKFLQECGIAPTQLCPNGWMTTVGFSHLVGPA
ncbi:Disease resistance protein RPP8 [Abeliophyllum distichum]|uniref:Disease resistance protein RPP8 n=1 Tax=Abeliophyllum distichum TaxID=126358 RepID=A0ABD1RVN1_9LAMI